jgi:4-hydroxy-tetrahydrodipicolinate synthase
MPLSAIDVRNSLRGVATGVLTPFDADRRIEFEKIEANVTALSGAGVGTFLAAANISEYHSLSLDERVAVTGTVVNALPSDACVLAGVGGNLAEATELIEEYDRIGVDALMIMPPDFTYLHEQGLLRYYEKLSEDTDTPLVPYVRGFDPSIRYLGELTRVDGLIGIKYAIPDAVKLGAGVEAGDDDVVWVDGLAEPYAPSFWAEGIEGFSAGVSNFRPEVGLALFDALSEGNWERARELKNICLPYQKFRSRTGQDNEIPDAVSVPAVKKGLELAGLHGGNVREPIQSLSPEDERRAEELYAQLDDDIDRLIR